MKKYTFVAAFVVVLMVLLPVTASASYTVSPKIIVDHTIWAGNIKITGNADGSITLHYMIKGEQGWCMAQSAIHVGLGIGPEYFPYDAEGVVHQQFFYQVYPDDMPCITDFTVTIAPQPGGPQWSHGDHVYIAVWLAMNNCALGYCHETGWGVRCGHQEGHEFPGPRWDLWIELTPDAWY